MHLYVIKYNDNSFRPFIGPFTLRRSCVNMSFYEALGVVRKYCTPVQNGEPIVNPTEDHFLDALRWNFSKYCWCEVTGFLPDYRVWELINVEGK